MEPIYGNRMFNIDHKFGGYVNCAIENIKNIIYNIMKHIKNFEDIKKSQLPEIGDYVICKDKSIALDEETKEFISNNIGKIINIITTGRPTALYIVKYDNIPNIAKKWFGSPSSTKRRLTDDSRQMRLNEIIKFSKNKEELEDYLIAKKYGL